MLNVGFSNSHLNVPDRQAGRICGGGGGGGSWGKWSTLAACAHVFVAHSVSETHLHWQLRNVIMIMIMMMMRPEMVMMVGVCT